MGLRCAAVLTVSYSMTFCFLLFNVETINIATMYRSECSCCGCARQWRLWQSDLCDRKDFVLSWVVKGSSEPCLFV
jgi:hypothetical protein